MCVLCVCVCVLMCVLCVCANVCVVCVCADVCCVGVGVVCVLTWHCVLVCSSRHSCQTPGQSEFNSWQQWRVATL